jgi:hypothetical protein
MSGRKTSITRFQVISNGSAAGNLTSAITNIETLDNIGYQINITGSPSGTFYPQVSADYAQDNNGNVLNAGNWVSLTLSPSLTVASGSPNVLYADLNQLSAPWLRLVFVQTGGTGTVNAFITAKML